MFQVSYLSLSGRKLCRPVPCSHCALCTVQCAVCTVHCALCTVHSASSYSCSYKMWLASSSKIFILFKSFFVTGLKAEEGTLSLDGSRTAYTNCDINAIKFQIRQLQYFGVSTKALLLSGFIEPHDVRPVLNFGIISLARILFEWRCCHYTSEVRATVILLLRLLSVQLNRVTLDLPLH